MSIEELVKNLMAEARAFERRADEALVGNDMVTQGINTGVSAGLRRAARMASEMIPAPGTPELTLAPKETG